MFSMFFSKCWSLDFGFPQGFGGFEGFRELQEAGRKNFHLVAPIITPGVTGYDRKNKMMNIRRMVFLNFRLRVKDLTVFDLRLDSSMPRSTRGSILS